MRLFRAGVKTEASWRTYSDDLELFRKWGKFTKFSDILELDDKALQITLEDYVLEMIETVHPNSVPTKWFGIQTFLEMNDVLINYKKKNQKILSFKGKDGCRAGWTTEEIQKMLEAYSSKMQAAIIHFESGSGGRLGIFDELMMKPLILLIDEKEIIFEDWLGNQTMSLDGACMAIVAYADEKEQYITFLPPEGTGIFFDYIKKRIIDGENMDGESPAFRQVYKQGSPIVKHATSKQIAQIVRRRQTKAGLSDQKTKKGHRFPVACNHGFRHRFDEIIKSIPGVNPHKTEKMFAHNSRLIAMDGIYNNPNIKNLFPEYKKIIPYITIGETERQKIQLEMKDR